MGQKEKKRKEIISIKIVFLAGIDLLDKRITR